MAERSYIAGAVAVSVVAAALHISTASSPLSSPASEAAASGGVHVRHSLQPANAKSPLDQLAWETEAKDHPKDLGKKTAEDELQGALADFYRTTVTAGSDVAAGDSIPANAFDAMIAIEPDPVHTHLALLFDRDIDTIEDALQTSGYQYQSNWLPWSPASSESASPASHVKEEQWRLFVEGRESFPGAILFRWERPSPLPGAAPSSEVRRPLVVFVVGNSPTAGIDRAQFENALAGIHKLAPGQTELRILGPTFSGSAATLRALLSGQDRGPLSQFHSIVIASGTMTDSSCRDILPAGQVRGEQCTQGDNPKVTFVSFGIDKDWRTRQIEAFLRRRSHFTNDQVAELTEEESSYGKGNSDGYLHLYFPRNISHLSSAYQKNDIFGFGASSSGSVHLSLDMNETSDDDAIANFATQQMPVSQDGVMQQITATLERRHIKVVLLSATDVLDEVFVAELLARQAPNVLVLVNQADNLFLRSTSPNDFTNMYFVSPFPLFDQGSYLRRIFPSDTAEGLYAAMLYLNAPPGPRAHTYLPDYGSLLYRTKRPDLWLTAVGHGDFWPMALLNDAQNQGRSPFLLPDMEQQPPVEPVRPDLPHLSQDLLLLCLGLLSLFHVAKCLGLPCLRDASFRYNISDLHGHAPKLSLQLGITLLLLLALQLCLTPLYQSSLARATFYGSGAALSAAAAYLIARMCMPAGCMGQLQVFAPQPFKRRLGFIALLSISALAGWLCLRLSWPALWDWFSPAPMLRNFLEYRASYPLRGVSPVFPLFLVVLGFGVLAYGHLDRIVFTQYLHPRLPRPNLALPNCPSDRDLEQVSRLLEWPARLGTIARKMGALSFVMFMAYLFIKALHLNMQMFDGVRLEKLLGVCMYLLIVAIIWELVMAAAIWNQLKSKCLEHLESSSLRRGFSSIEGITWSSLWIFRGSLQSRYRLIQRLLEQAVRAALQQVAREPKDGENLEKEIRAFSELLAAPTSLQALGEAFGKVQDRMALAVEELLEQLRHQWERQSEYVTAADRARDQEKENCCCPQEPADQDKVNIKIQEEWVALFYLHYTRMVLLQVRSRLVVASTLYLFLVWAATCYPYLNRHSILVALASLLGLLSFTVILIYSSINRDAILSRATNHPPGSLDLDFYLKTFSLVGVPLIGFVASQFPEVSSFLFSWLEPGMAAMR